jgi:hypothetical protein
MCLMLQIPIRLFYSDKQENGSVTRLDWTYEGDE